MTISKILTQNILLFVLLAALSACEQSEQQATPPDLVVINGDVHTVASTISRADAFAVTGRIFVAVGDAAQISSMAGEDTIVIDAGGVSIIPGLIDGHTHLIGGAVLATGVDLSEIEDKNEWLRIIRAKADSLPSGTWILGGAWNHDLSDGVLPTKEMLDSAAPDHPVLLRDITGNRLVLGSDWATSPLNPLIQIADTLHRETRIDGVVRLWDEGNTLTFAEALKGYTQAGADMTPWTDEIGSIPVGKWADFVILDERLPESIDRSVENREVTATYLAGKQVYP